MGTTKDTVIRAALKVGISESAAILIGDQLEQEGIQVSQGPKPAVKPQALNVQPAKETPSAKEKPKTLKQIQEEAAAKA